MKETSLSFEATARAGEVGAILIRPADAHCLYVFGHGAGAGMRHAFMQRMAGDLAERGVATFRYQFPYMEAGRRAPNPRPVLIETVRSAVAAARRAAPGLRLIAGGKSMGGRMTSLAASEESLAAVDGLVFLGFPLHASGKPSSDRGAHLQDVGVPMLFVQGTRDRLADLDLLNPLLATVRPTPSVHIVDEGDHSFHVPKRTGLTHDDVIATVAGVIAEWTASLPT